MPRSSAIWQGSRFFAAKLSLLHFSGKIATFSAKVTGFSRDLPGNAEDRTTGTRAQEERRDHHERDERAATARRHSSGTRGRPIRAGRASSAPTPPPTWSGCAARSRGAHAGPARRRTAVGAAARGTVRQRARRDDRQPGRAAGPGRAEGDLPVRLAGRRRREPGRADLPRPEPVPGQLGPPVVRRINNALLRADQITWAESPTTARRTGSPRSWPTPRPGSAAC